MAQVLLGSDTANMNTAVPNYFIDEYMADANGEYVKVYLYLLRCMNSAEESISISKMADKFDHTEKDIRRALNYWEKVNLLRLEFDEEDRLIGIYFVDTQRLNYTHRQKSDAISLHKETMHKEKREVLSQDTKKYYNRDEVDQFKTDGDVKELLFVASQYVGHPLSNTEVSTVMYWYENLHFSIDLIEYLIEYCSENDHTSLRYMDKVAMSWKDSGITTAEEARENIHAHSKMHYQVMKAFGISGRRLAESETEFLDKWTSQYRYEEDMIVEACNRTIQAIHHPSFEYADSILTNWFKSNAASLEDVAVLDQEYQKSKASKKTTTTKTTNKFNNFAQRTYNYEQLERQFEEQMLGTPMRK